MDILENDMDIIQKIINKEINLYELPEQDVKRLINICQCQNDNLDKRISDKEEKIAKLEDIIEQYKSNENL